MDKRIIRLTDANGCTIAELDISGIEHANTTWPITLTVQTRCDMGHWHTNSTWDLPVFGRAVKQGDAALWNLPVFGSAVKQGEALWNLPVFGSAVKQGDAL